MLPASSGGSDSNSGLSWGTAFATFDHALSTIKDAGGGVVRLGPGVHTLIDPGGAGPYTLGANNLTIIGVPGQTLLQCPYQLEDGFAVGTDAYTESGNQYIEWYARDVIFDCNGGGGFLIGAVAGWRFRTWCSSTRARARTTRRLRSRLAPISFPASTGASTT